MATNRGDGSRFELRFVAYRLNLTFAVKFLSPSCSLKCHRSRCTTICTNDRPSFPISTLWFARLFNFETLTCSPPISKISIRDTYLACFQLAVENSLSQSSFSRRKFSTKERRWKLWFDDLKNWGKACVRVTNSWIARALERLP